MAVDKLSRSLDDIIAAAENGSRGNANSQISGRKRARTAPSESIRVATRVYVGNLSFRTQWPELKDYFKQCGDVVFAKVLQTADGSSKGCGIVEFSSATEAAEAINTLHNTEFEGRQIFIREDRDDFDLLEYRRQWQRGSIAKRQRAPDFVSVNKEHRQQSEVHVSNLSYKTSWQDLKDHFNEHGDVTFAEIFQDNQGKPTGQGAVTFASVQAANKARRSMNGSCNADSQWLADQDEQLV